MPPSVAAVLLSGRRPLLWFWVRAGSRQCTAPDGFIYRWSRGCSTPGSLNPLGGIFRSRPGTARASVPPNAMGAGLYRGRTDQVIIHGLLLQPPLSRDRAWPALVPTLHRPSSAFASDGRSGGQHTLIPHPIVQVVRLEPNGAEGQPPLKTNQRKRKPDSGWRRLPALLTSCAGVPKGAKGHR